MLLYCIVMIQFVRMDNSVLAIVWPCGPHRQAYVRHAPHSTHTNVKNEQQKKPTANMKESNVWTQTVYRWYHIIRMKAKQAKQCIAIRKKKHRSISDAYKNWIRMMHTNVPLIPEQNSSSSNRIRCGTSTQFTNEEKHTW